MLPHYVLIENDRQKLMKADFRANENPVTPGHSPNGAVKGENTE